MGIYKLLPKVDPSMRECSLSELQGQVAAIDTSIWIYKALLQQRDPTQTILQKVNELKHFGIVPVLVLDGAAPEAKKELIEFRMSQKDENLRRALEEKKAGNLQLALHFFKKSRPRTTKCEDAIKSMCKDKRIRFIQSPFEADSQIAFMLMNNFADVAITEDSDFITYGCQKILFKLRHAVGDLYEKKSLSLFLGEELDMTTFRAICILMGCDFYMRGVKGIGPEKAMQIYKELAHNFTLEKMKQMITEKFCIKLDADFDSKFARADLTFQYQLVIHPTTKQFLPLTPLTSEARNLDLSFAGRLDKAKGEAFFWCTKEDCAVGKALDLSNVKIVQRTYTCRSCPSEFPTSAKLAKHKRDEHPYVCEVCKRRFACKAYLTDHNKIHTGVLLYFCDICDAGFCTLQQIRAHKTRCHPKETHDCPICSKSFARLDHLAQHQAVHTGAKSFVCDVCGVGFAAKCTLRNHQSVHTKAKLFRCQICGLGFARKSTLENHQSVHTKAKPFRCNICSKGFARKSSLEDHQGVHANGKPFVCETCGAGYCSRANLKRHVKKTHLADLSSTADE